MKISYIPVVIPHPLPSLGHKLFRYRPVYYVRVSSPSNGMLFDGLLDTGSDETVFQERVAHAIGFDLTGAEEREIEVVGRPAPIRCRYVSVQLQISDGRRETSEWTAVVGFTATRLQYNLLGHSGFLEFFDADFRGATREVILIPNRSFPGTRVAMPPRP